MSYDGLVLPLHVTEHIHGLVRVCAVWLFLKTGFVMIWLILLFIQALNFLDQIKMEKYRLM